VLALAAVLALVVGTAIVASGTAPPRTPEQMARDAADEERVNDELYPYLEDTCLSEAEARGVIRDRLDGLGLSDWTIRPANIPEAPCVGAAPIGDTHEVILYPSMGGRVNDALEALKVELLRACLNPTEATELLRSTLASAGVPDPRVEVRGIHDVLGPPVGVPGPPDGPEASAYLQHLADGCVVFGNAQSDQNGRYTWTLRVL
jgi:hypothetical protein